MANLAVVIIETSDFELITHMIIAWKLDQKTFEILVSWQYKRTILLPFAAVFRLQILTRKPIEKFLIGWIKKS